MINDSVARAYMTIDALSKQVEIAEKEGGLPKSLSQSTSKKNKKGLLSRSKDMFKYNAPETKEGSENREKQKLVIAYVLRIRKAFEEVKNGRATTNKSE
tara:strand:+ start:1106 stop:1402 length:297 start_codon:yes stop_codon:yes gene_type:complete